MQRQRTRPELADFLRHKRESLSPTSVGLPATNRRRTPGLRREEVAALAGVGLTCYTWLEQGRDIGVSSQFLDRLAKVFQLNQAERRHLYLLTSMRHPLETGITEYQVPASIQRIMDDLPADYLCYVLNLHWDVLAFNSKADQYFGFSSTTGQARNFLWLLFADERYQQLLPDWKTEAYQLLSSFRRDYALNKHDPNIQAMIRELTQISSVFEQMWNRHEIYQPCSGIRQFAIQGVVQHYQYSSLTFDLDKHNRLIIYAPLA